MRETLTSLAMRGHLECPFLFFLDCYANTSESCLTPYGLIHFVFLYVVYYYSLAQ